MSKTKLSDLELWQCLSEAEARKADSTLPIDVRVRSFDTYSLCLREADYRGYDYVGLRDRAANYTREFGAIEAARLDR